MRRTWTILLTVLASSAAAAPPRPPMPRAAETRPAAVDLSTPLAAARAYAACMVGGDPSAVRTVGTGDEPTCQQAETAAAQAGASYELAEAAATRFGPDARRYEFFARDREADRNRWSTRLATARVNIEGDSALVFDPDGAWRLTLKKAGDGWKVELPPALNNKEQHASSVRWMAANAVMIRALAADVRAGRFATAGAIETARRERTAQLKAELLTTQSKRLGRGQ